MTYRDQFPTYAEADMSAIPANWQDTSWRNDACPSFLIMPSLAAFVDFAKPEDREFEDGCRFSLHRMEDGQHTDGPDSVIGETDDFNELLAMAISAEFVDSLRQLLSDDEFAEMQQRNASRQQGVCHSHDFCDANMPMAAAFEAITGRDMLADSDADASLWNRAWELAMPSLTKREAANV